MWGQVKWSADQQSCSSFCQRRQQGSLFNMLYIFVSHTVHDDHRLLENNNIYLQDSHGLVELERLVFSYKTRMTTRPILSRTSTLSRSKKTMSLAQFWPLCGPLTLMLGTTVKYATQLVEKTLRLSRWMLSQVSAPLPLKKPASFYIIFLHSLLINQCVPTAAHSVTCLCRRAFLCNTPLTDFPCSRRAESCVVSGQGGEGGIPTENHSRGPWSRCPAVWLCPPQNTATGC